MKKEELKKLVDRIKSMTAKEVVLTMVEALRNPLTKIDMHSWGTKRGNICYGCAATNTICKIGGFDPFSVLTHLNERSYATWYEDDTDEILDLKTTVSIFEGAINELRTGDIQSYNRCAIAAGMSVIDNIDYDLPHLSNDYTENELKIYENFANTL